MQYLEKTLYWISSGLLIPVMVAVIFFLIRGLVLVGQFYGFYIERLKFYGMLRQRPGGLDSGDMDDLPELLSGSKILLSRAIGRLLALKDDEIRRDKIIADFEIECEKDLDRSRTLSKTGPMLGLMGTLIPLGPALSGLAAGDMAVMSQQMQIAFNTTVMGLLIGAIGYLTLQTKQRWYAADMNQLEFVNDMLNKLWNEKKGADSHP
jgi:biopolymer transport protein ExbB/TolQ